MNWIKLFKNILCWISNAKILSNLSQSLKGEAQRHSVYVLFLFGYLVIWLFGYYQRSDIYGERLRAGWMFSVPRENFVDLFFFSPSVIFREVLCLEFLYCRVVTGSSDGKVRFQNLSGFQNNVPFISLHILVLHWLTFTRVKLFFSFFFSASHLESVKRWLFANYSWKQ